jgi:hypothetical protein
MSNKYESATPRKMNLLGKISNWIFLNPVLVYSVGKVGSSSIVNTMRKHGVHEVQPHSLQMSRRGSYFVLPEFRYIEKIYFCFKSWLMKRKTSLYLFSHANKKIKVISLYREPISRNISAFFEQYQYVLDKNINDYATEGLINEFWKHANHDAPLVWFDEEIKKTFNINVFDYPFDKEKGYTVIKKGNVELLLLTMEKVNDLENEIGDFLNIAGFKLAKTNRAEKKPYSEIYKHFKKDLTIEPLYMEKMYESQSVKYFYTAETIASFKTKWTLK